MNKKQLLEFKSEVEKVLAERKALGDFDANSKYMVFLLGNMRALIDHAISQHPKAVKDAIEDKAHTKKGSSSDRKNQAR